jgi:hypothetical protein
VLHLIDALATLALQQFIRDRLRVDDDEIRGVAVWATVIAGADHPATHVTKRCTIDAAQCATRATKFVIEDGGLFEYCCVDRVAGGRSEGGIARWRNAERWFVMRSSSGCEYTPLVELMQWLLRCRTRFRNTTSAHQQQNRFRPISVKAVVQSGASSRVGRRVLGYFFNPTQLAAPRILFLVIRLAWTRLNSF